MRYCIRTPRGADDPSVRARVNTVRILVVEVIPPPAFVVPLRPDLLTRDLVASTIDVRASQGRRSFRFGPEPSFEHRLAGELSMSQKRRGACLGGLAFVAALVGCRRDEPVVGSTPDALGVAKAVATPANPETSGTANQLVLVETVTRDDLSKVVSSAISPDGRLLYASSWDPGAGRLLAPPRDGQTDSRPDHDRQARPAAPPASRSRPTARFAVLGTFQSKDAVLFRRDPRSGTVELLQIAPRAGKDWEFPVLVKSSPNGKFACFADDGGRPGPGGIRVFRVEGERLVDVSEDAGHARCFNGAQPRLPSGRQDPVRRMRPPGIAGGRRFPLRHG